MCAVTIMEPMTEGELATLTALRRQRRHIEQQITMLLHGRRVHLRREGPLHHCKRCGYEWHGHWNRKIPKACARCHSAYWNDEPIHDSARHPDDPPNPRWPQLVGERSARTSVAASSGLPPPPRRPLAEQLAQVTTSSPTPGKETDDEQPESPGPEPAT